MFDIFGSGPARNDNERLVDRAIRGFYRTKALESAGDSALDWLIDTDDEKLDRENKRLRNAQMRRSLGLPMSDDDYELATNEGLSFRQKGAVAAFGKHVAKTVPEPGFLTPPAARGLLESSFPKTTKLADAGSYLLSNSMRAAGGKYGGGILGRFFGR